MRFTIKFCCSHLLSDKAIEPRIKWVVDGIFDTTNPYFRLCGLYVYGRWPGAILLLSKNIVSSGQRYHRLQVHLRPLAGA